MSTFTYSAGGVTFLHSPIMIGAGVCKTPARTQDWLQVAPVVSGSYTPEAREGNEGNLFFPETEKDFQRVNFGLNSFGMPNMGFLNAVEAFTSMTIKNPLIISVAGFSTEDYHKGILVFRDVASAIELNFGCSNIEHEKITSFDLRFLDTLFRDLVKCNYQFPIWAKFSPYSDPGMLKEVASTVNEYEGAIKAVVTCNTFPYAFAGVENISPNDGFAGLSGPVMKLIARGQVRQFRQHLNPEIDVIGVGGITTGNDVVDFLDDGARAVQLASMPFWSGDPGKFWEKLINAQDGIRLEKYLIDNMERQT